MMQQQPDKRPGLSWSTPRLAEDAPSRLGVFDEAGESRRTAGQSAPKQASIDSGSPKQLLPPLGDKNSHTAMYAAMFVVGLIVGLLLAWGWSALRSSGPASMTASSSEQTQTGTQAGTDAMVGVGDAMQGDDLIVPSPQKAGQSVIITQASVGKPTWVVVYEARDGAPGNVLGAQLFFTSGPGIVTLLRGTTAGQTYYVGKSVDDGDHKYTKATDKPTLNIDGSVAAVSFTVN